MVIAPSMGLKQMRQAIASVAPKAAAAATDFFLTTLE